MKYHCLIVLLLVCLQACFCGRNGILIPDLLYTPPITFTGFINGNEVTLPGNRTYPNTCTTYNDTVFMMLRSSDYVPGSASFASMGMYMRILILPERRRDSLDTMPRTMIGIKEIIFHMSRHTDLTETYEILPKDSMNTSAVGFQMEVISLSRSAGSVLHLKKIATTAPAQPGTNARQGLVIEMGEIIGTIE